MWLEMSSCSNPFCLLEQFLAVHFNQIVFLKPFLICFKINKCIVTIYKIENCNWYINRKMLDIYVYKISKTGPRKGPYTCWAKLNSKLDSSKSIS